MASKGVKSSRRRRTYLLRRNPQTLYLGDGASSLARDSGGETLVLAWRQHRV